MATTGRHQTAPQAPGKVRRAVDVIDDRLGIKALEYPVPEHANGLAWSLGGVTACAFALLVVTGILLVQFYAPVPEVANQSVRDMVTQVWGMRFVRACTSGPHKRCTSPQPCTCSECSSPVRTRSLREGNW